MNTITIMYGAQSNSNSRTMMTVKKLLFAYILGVSSSLSCCSPFKTLLGSPRCITIHLGLTAKDSEVCSLNPSLENGKKDKSSKGIVITSF